MHTLCLSWKGASARQYCACRGIDVVRNKIKMFAQTKVTLPPGRHKMVILDEADRWGCRQGRLGSLLCRVAE